MTPFDKFIEFITRQGMIELEAVILGKAAVILLLLLYLAFSLVVVRQVNLMNKTINGLMEKRLLVAAKALVGLAMVVLILGLIVL
ncbi:MAG: hypothetical protein UX85_C0008G0038 [Candidatus Beckwithbacteria bacterium GW2011_GWB1_47_15]|uniref:Uncharacterized protein n=1 Tax=Candidatus Beckwithbacteria bacterium GW2011_GWB1_47_15 TaxID=1618371 RepID=A0A0G1RTP7_9BACT|nr:MAG: hypothetical protein UY43_C0001G0007 [Candidatus Beckwithbacteria bacterium GW2011_GWC1_49_16]KKU34641.1 MAG: hypothetical protein UX50_C0015G0013 [Candidatus Beckwithbacteria bacterium GW2011_GWA1_46_30]KKU60664.1 MAG: hypothetical protein UX85_C0008G0038 [Candidatus Beckwithbacteria bacterium GW2011_GWB1_47_15]KKU71218.1 MAG: hypothetical protein UX97_C0010G0013 [Candidatus Beckwithbacteria bacterium GW2011_GWA2_47_25]KKW03109.1 MAG: hypothetical protein UY37_C0007G0063 [Candidatus Be